jgi:ACS family pantothenate transporter-like MFS transporter
MLCLGYFIKGLDQANIGTAFISGMQEDLQMYGNQLNLVDTSWTVGAFSLRYPCERAFHVQWKL